MTKAYNKDDNDLLFAVGQQIRYIRKMNNLTQEQLAEKAGIKTSYITGIENGKRNTSLATLNRLTNALEIHPTQLFQYQNIEPVSGDKFQTIKQIQSYLASRSEEEINWVLKITKETMETFDRIRESSIK
ncbi:XRE family transcriptional regulator [Paenibacillus sp. JMULE4]|uniref:Helix-turn-helix domain-containing protein n=1 Tax=Paenibacillus validus TaxID=44253 RepID=A0A7X3CWB2_9BACL|nr:MULTISPECIES: helix-turn-helix transcriptional regulator [Paenibacillus]MUG73989.1 helix-turn-helix domain-containing protein [Paenibacillus validus]NTZ19441.1 XRE family transcriptional regulator [Paenibacillus sp. JMULE4]